MRLFEERRHAEVLAVAAQMTGQHPRFVLGWQALGLTLGQTGRAPEAVGPMRKAAELAPDDATTHFNLGVILQGLSDLAEAEACFRRAVHLRPDFAGAHYNLGLALLGQNQPGDACESFRKAVDDPGFAQAHPEALNHLGAALELSGRVGEAEVCYRDALRLRPDHPEANNNLANLLTQVSRLHEAEALYRRALQVKPDFAEAHDHLGAALQDLGRFAEAQASYRKALQIDPGFAKARSDLLLCLNFTDQPISGYLEEARAYGRAASAGVMQRYRAWHCAFDARRLRVGLVSGDLREHPVGYFLESLLEHIDPGEVELFAYPTTHHVDDLTRRVQGRFAAWRSIFQVADDAAARTIHADGVHILLDLSGHTANNRLPVFAYRPAPVQATWLGYFASTGLAEMDWILLDRVSSPYTDSQAFTERIYHLPGPRYCFTAPAIDAPVDEPPCLSRGYVTFCCFNTLNKMNDAVVALWARVLLAVPGSRLFLKAKHLQDSFVCADVIRRFGDHGIQAERLVLEGKSPRAEYLNAYRRADIALDPFPYTGGTTSLEALWMGVPVLTMRGDRLLSRQGASILTYADLGEWIADGADDFVQRAVDRARDLQGLAELRAQLRARLTASPLLDAAGFARHFQAALLEIWNVSRDRLASQ